MDEFFTPGCFHSHKIAKSNFNGVKNPSRSPTQNQISDTNELQIDFRHIFFIYS